MEDQLLSFDILIKKKKKFMSSQELPETLN